VAAAICKDLVCVGYFAASAIKPDLANTFFILLELAVIVHLYLEARRFYRFLRVSEISLLYEYQFQIADLMVNLLILAHFFVTTILCSP
jgi:hypothetical protein